MSITTGDFRSKVTTTTLLEKKAKNEPIVCITAYDFVSACLVDRAGIDMILVGDSLAQTMLGYESTLPVSMEEMLHHVRAVRRGVKRAFLVADMPYGSYHIDNKEALANAARFVKEAGAEAVKIEGGTKRASLVEQMLDAEIPVVGHLGLTPQSLHMMGGYKVQGKTLGAIEALVKDAIALDRAGVCSIVLEGIPREVATIIRSEVSVPTIGIGAGPDCDGQILVLHDILNLSFNPRAKFVRQYADVAEVMSNAFEQYAEDVKTGKFPNDSESYHLPKDTLAALDTVIARKRALKK